MFDPEDAPRPPYLAQPYPSIHDNFQVTMSSFANPAVFAVSNPPIGPTNDVSIIC